MNKNRAYMREGEYDKECTNYKHLANFYLDKRFSDEVFKSLEKSNRVTLPSNYFRLSKSHIRTGTDQDEIYIRALYHKCPIKAEAYLLISNDARRMIMSLYRERNEKKAFKDKLLNRIQSKFGYFDNSYHNFLDHLVAERALIAGSFPLQILLDENWVGSDLDIFVMQGYGKHLKKFLVNHSILEKDLSGSIITQAKYPESLKVFEYILPSSGFRVQLIFTKHTSVSSILAEFDLDICKIGWNFWKDDLIIADREAIDKKTCCYPKNIKDKTNDRITKYKKRGFTFNLR